MPLRLYDAHNHLQDDRLKPFLGELMKELPLKGVHCAVVNGSCEDDWETVACLARLHPWIWPSFGLHPWYVHERSPDWQKKLLQYLDEFPKAGVGEIGLDRWIPNPDIEAQTSAFLWQLNLATQQNRPTTIHCLRAWGMLGDLLSSYPVPERGFLLHSFGGPIEMIPQFAKKGAYFSLSPYFCHERKSRQAAAFAHVPIERLLAETDAPDMWPPDEENKYPLLDSEQKRINHPANLEVSYQKLAALRQMPLEELTNQIEINFHRLFSSTD
jgi:TatD DNase family protein